MFISSFSFQGLTSSLTVQVSQNEILPVGYTVNVTRVEVVHIGKFISNAFLSVGDTHSTSSDITVSESSVRLAA